MMVWILNFIIPQVLFILKLTSLADGTFRVIVDEKQLLKPRYRVQYALSRDPTEDK